MELTLCDEKNPIKEWMQVARSTQEPELDEEDTEGDCPLPSHLVTDTIASVDLQRETGSQNLSQHRRLLVTAIWKKGRRPLCGLQFEVRELRE